MPRFRVEYEVTSDLVLTAESGRIDFENENTTFVVTNGPKDDQGHCKNLLVVVIGEAEDISKAVETLSEPLAQQLDLLSFTTHHRFQIGQARRIFLWEPHLKERPMQFCHSFDPRYPPAPDLDPIYFETIKQLTAAKAPSYMSSCLRNFRYGCISEQIDEQYKRFFAVIEGVAESTKQIEPVAHACPKCAADVECAKCGHVATRVPMAKQAVEQLLARICGPGWEGVSKRVFEVRNGLVHGRRQSSIEKVTGISLAQCTDEIGALAWHALMAVFDPLLANQEIELGHRDGQFHSKAMSIKTEGFAIYDGDLPYPPDHMLPSATITVQSGFRADRPQ